MMKRRRRKVKRRRTTALTPMLLANLECYTTDEIMKIMKMEPSGNKIGHKKAKIGTLADSDRTDNIRHPGKL